LQAEFVHRVTNDAGEELALDQSEELIVRCPWLHHARRRSSFFFLFAPVGK
jgi:hypothetical protein